MKIFLKDFSTMSNSLICHNYDPFWSNQSFIEVKKINKMASAVSQKMEKLKIYFVIIFSLDQTPSPP